MARLIARILGWRNRRDTQRLGSTLGASLAFVAMLFANSQAALFADESWAPAQIDPGSVVSFAGTEVDSQLGAVATSGTIVFGSAGAVEGGTYTYTRTSDTTAEMRVSTRTYFGASGSESDSSTLSIRFTSSSSGEYSSRGSYSGTLDGVSFQGSYTGSGRFSLSSNLLRVTGTLLDATTLEPVPDALVSIQPSESTEESDAEGSFSITVAPGGEKDLVVTIEKDGYVTSVIERSTEGRVGTLALGEIRLSRIFRITEVKSRVNGIFLGDFDYSNRFTAQIVWNGRQPGTAEWYINGALVRTTYADVEKSEVLFNMGRDFPARTGEPSLLTVVAVTATGERSEPHTIPVLVVPRPQWLTLLTPYTVGLIDGAMDFSITIPLNTPEDYNFRWIGRVGLDLKVDFPARFQPKDGSFKAGPRVSSGYTVKNPRRFLTRVGNSSFSGKTEIKMIGKATIDSGLTIEEAEATFGLDARGRIYTWVPAHLAPLYEGLKSYDKRFNTNFATAVTFPIDGTASVSASTILALAPGLSYSGSKLGIALGLEGSYTFQPFDGQGVRFAVGGRGSWSWRLNDPISIEDYTLEAYAEAEVRAWMLLREIRVAFGTGGITTTAAAHAPDFAQVSLNRNETAATGADWQVVERPWLRRDSPTTGLTSDNEQRVPAASANGSENERNEAGRALASNLPDFAAPSLAIRGSERMVVYVGDNGGPDLQFTDVIWTHFDGTSWSTPTPIGTDTRAEFSPQVAFTSSGDAVAIWERVRDPDLTNTEVTYLASQMEIVWSHWNRALKQWSTPRALTDNLHLDHRPRLTDAMDGGSLMAVWVENTSNLLSGTTTNPSRLRYATWQGSTGTWTSAENAIGLVSREDNLSLSGAGRRAIVGWIQDVGSDDADGVVTSDVFGAIWNGDSWSGVRQVTRDGVQKLGARTAAGASGELLLAWQTAAGIQLVADLETQLPPPPQSSDTLPGGFAMTASSDGRLAVIRSDKSQAGADLYLSVWIPDIGVWTPDHQITDTPSHETAFQARWTGQDGLTLSTLDTAISYVTKTLVLEDGTTATFESVPETRQVDLIVDAYPIAPDLYAVDSLLSVRGESILPGNQVTLAVTVRNGGSSSAPAPIVRFFAGHPGSQGAVIGETRPAGPLAPGEATEVAVDWVIPLSNSPIPIFAEIDPDRTIPESSERNNMIHTAVGGVDLAVNVVTATPGPGGTVHVIADVRNLGFPTATDTSVSIARAGEPSPLLQVVSVPTLPPGATTHVEFYLPEGTHTLGEEVWTLKASPGDDQNDINVDNNHAGFFSNRVAPPTISLHPTASSPRAGQAATFRVVGAGGAPLSYVWQRRAWGSSQFVDLEDGERYAGTRTSQLTVVATDRTSAGDQFRCFVSDGTTSVVSAAALLTLEGDEPPVVTRHPEGRTVAQGSSTVFACEFLGEPTPTIQWFKDGVPIVGATRAEYAISSVRLSDEGDYTAELINSSGRVTSLAARLKVITPLPSARASWLADGNASDSSGNGHHGTVNGSIGYAPGIRGQAFSFDGVDDWISAGLALPADSAHTIAAWVKWSGWKGNESHQEIVSWWNTTDPAANRTFVGPSRGGGQGPMRYGDTWNNVPVSLPVGIWTHLAFTYDATTNTRTVFVDGLPVASRAATDEARFGGLLAIGRQGQLSGEYWHGLIDELTIHDSALAPLQIGLLAGAFDPPEDATPNPYTMSVFTGQPFVAGATDGAPNGTARFNGLRDLVFDSLGNLYAVDRNSINIRKITPDGTVSNFIARHDGADVLAIDPANNLYTNYYPTPSGLEIGRISPSGVVSRFGRWSGSNADWGIGELGGMAIQPTTGTFIHTDTIIHGVMTVNASGGIEMIAGNDDEVQAGAVDGSRTRARFREPRGIAFDASGNAFVCDAGNHTIRRVAASTGNVTTIAGSAGLAGHADGSGAAARFNTPTDIVLSASGDLFVTDLNNHVVRRVTQAGVVTTYAGTPGESGHGDGLPGRLFSPRYLAIDRHGDLFVTSGSYEGGGGWTIRRITAEGAIVTFAGNPTQPGNAGGTAASATFRAPWGHTVDEAGNLYVPGNDDRTIRKVSPTGHVTTIAGATFRLGSEDGTARQARFSTPQNPALDPDGNLYVIDYNAIRRISPAGDVSTIAGQVPSTGFADGVGMAARFREPRGLAWGPDGHLYVADTLNHVIRRVSAAGVVTTFAGQVGTTGSADGPAAAALFDNPACMTFTPNGDLYVIDRANQTIRRITPEGLVSTVAGSLRVTGTADGVGPAAQFNWPAGIASDAAGNLFIADQNNYAVRLLSPDGRVTTIAGQPGTQGRADGTGTVARFNLPRGISVNREGVLHVFDVNARIILRGTAAPWITRQPEARSAPRGSSVTFSAAVAGTGPFTYQWKRDGIAVGTGASLTLSDLQAGDAGDYWLVARSPHGAVSSARARLTVTGIVPPSISQHPVSASSTAGGSLSLSVVATGEAPLAYQWKRDGLDIVGATAATYSLPSAQSFHAGTYTCVVTSSGGISTSSSAATITVAAPPPSDARLMNLSTRALCQTGDSILIPGFVISGTGTKKMLIRGVGPRLTRFGVADALADPILTLKRDVGNGVYSTLAVNDDWSTNTNKAEIVSVSAQVFAFSLPDGSKDSALLVELPAGSYTVPTAGVGDATGVSLVELYDADPGSPSARLVNISNRGFVGVGGQIMIPGFVVSNEGSRTFLIRAVGPRLTRFGVTGVLQDPELVVYFRDSQGVDHPILANDDWGTGADAVHTAAVARQVFAFSLEEGSKDAAFVVTLPPGAYTVNAKGKAGSTGVALVEVYLVP